MKSKEFITEWVDPGPPCKVCGKPHGSHKIKFTFHDNPNVHYLRPDDEWSQLNGVENAEDHEYEPNLKYKPLTKAEAAQIGYELLTDVSKLPDDIYNRIHRIRNIKLVK